MQLNEDLPVETLMTSSPLQQYLTESTEENPTMSHLQQNLTDPYPENSAVVANLPDTSAEPSTMLPQQQCPISHKRM